MIKQYGNFINKNNINKNINEGLLSNMFSKFWAYLKWKFGKKTWINYVKFLKAKNKLDPSKVEIFICGKPLTIDNSVKNLDVDFEEVQAQNETPVQSEIQEENPIEIQKEKISLLNFDDFKMNEERVSLSVENDIDNVNMKELKEDLVSSYKLRVSGKSKYMNPMFIWGAPGIGKTEAIVQVCEKLKLDLIVWHLATIEPVDFVGLPSVKNNRTIFNLPAIFPNENEIERGGILFLDEINRANRSVLSASLQLANEGHVGNYHLPKSWWVVCAGNRPEDEPGRVEELGSALSGRFSHVNLVPTVNEWLEWSKENNKIHNDVFLFFQIDKNKKEYFHNLDTDKGDVPWPNPRNWVKASEMYEHQLEERGDLSEREVERIFRHTVGKPAATAFLDFLKIKKIFTSEDIQQVWTNPTEAKIVENERIDVLLSIMVYIVYWSVDKKLDAQLLENAFSYADKYKNTESTSLFMAMIIELHPYIRTDKVLSKIYLKYVQKWHYKQNN